MNTTNVGGGGGRGVCFGRWGGGAAVMVVLLSWTGGLSVAGTGDELLATERWREDAYGVSLLPPLGSRLAQRSADDAVLRINSQTYAINLYIKKSTVQIPLKDILSEAIHQLGTVYPSAVILAQEDLTPAGRPGALIYFKIPNHQLGPWVMGQTFMRLDHRAWVVLQMEVKQRDFESARKVYRAVIDSLQVQDPELINRQRTQQVRRGQAWLDAINLPRLTRSLEPERWFRILKDDQDVGYMRVAYRTDTQMAMTGLRVDVQVRVRYGPNVFDSLSNFFLSDDSDQEFWSVRTSVRSADPQGQPSPDEQSPAPTRDGSWAETGVRGGDQITLSRETPTGIRHYRWQRPETGYLPQVYLYLMDHCLAGPNTLESPKSESPKTSPPPDTSELGFYAYNPSTQRIDYQTHRVVKSADQTTAVYTQPSPDQPEQISYYDPRGRLVKRVLPNGQLILPSTKQQITLKWRLR